MSTKKTAAGGAADDGTKLTKKNAYLSPGAEPQKDASNPKVRVKSATSMKVYEPTVVKGFDDVEAGKTEGVANEHGAAKKKKKIKISCYQKMVNLRHPRLIHPSRAGIILVRSFDMIVWIVYYFLLRHWQFRYLPEGPPFFNPLIEHEREFKDAHRTDLEYTSRTFINTTQNMYDSHEKSGMDEISIDFIGTPVGIWLLQIPILVRLTASFFVGCYESGLPVLTWPQNAAHVRANMIWSLVVAFPWQLMEIPLRRSRQDPNILDPLASDGLFLFIHFLGLIRILQFQRDLYWFRSFIGNFSNVISFFLFGGIVEFVVEYCWMCFPEFFCGQEGVRPHDVRHQIIDCWSNNCSLFSFNFTGNNTCFVETWWSLMHYNTRLTTTTYNISSDKQAISLVQSVDNILDLNNYHHFFIYTSTKSVGIGYGAATNHYEALFVIFIFAGGQYFYNWKISGFIDTIALAGDAARVADEKQLGIVKTFCTMHEADDKTKDVIKRYCKDFQVQETQHMIDTEAFKERLPGAYQDLIMFPTLVKILRKDIRIFQDVGAHIQLCLAYQFISQTYVRGDTVVQENEEPLGLMYIRQGSMMAIHTNPKKGGIVRMEKGDFFGEISLNFNFVSPVVIKAVTDCEVFVLVKTDYQKILRLLPVHIQNKMVQNHADIINTMVCRFLKPMTFKKLPRVFQGVRLDAGFSLEKLGLKLGLLRRQGGKLVQLHDEMPSYKRWIHTAGLLGLIAAVIAFIDVLPCDIYDGWLPCNPYSLFNCRLKSQDHYFNTILVKAIGIISFLLTIFFLVDLILVSVVGINTPYGIITGFKAFKAKLGKKYGSQNYIKIISPFFIGLRLLRFKDLLQYHVSFRILIFMGAALMLMLLITVCHYAGRLVEAYVALMWENALCVYHKEEWQGKSLEMLKSMADQYDLKGLNGVAEFIKEDGLAECKDSSDMVTDPICRNYIPMLTPVSECDNSSSSPTCDHLFYFRRNIDLTTFTESMCKEKYSYLLTHDTDDNEGFGAVYRRYLRVVYELLTIASAEGSDVTAYYVTDPGRYQAMIVVILGGIVLRGMADAYLLTVYSEEYMPTIHTYNRLEKIRNHLKSSGTSKHASAAVVNFLSACYSTFNQITITSEAYILHMLPVRLRRFAKEKNAFMELDNLFHNKKFIEYLTEHSREFFFPPGVCCAYDGDLSADVMLIIRGVCFEIDEFGYYYFRGPGDFVGLLSLWTGHQSATILCHSYVQCFIIEKHTLLRAFDIFRYTKRCFFPSMIGSLPVMVTTTARLDDFKVRHDVAINEAPIIRAMVKRFNFSNVPTAGIWRSPPRLHWKCPHKAFLLNATLNPHSKIGYAYLALKMICFLGSIFASSGQLAFLAYKAVADAFCLFFDSMTILLCYIEWHLMYYNEETSVLVKDPVLTTKRWFKQQSVVGFLTTFPVEALVVIFYPAIVDDHRQTYLAIKFIFRLIRYIPYTRTFTALRKLHLDWTRSMIICKSLVHLALCLHLFALWWFMVQCQPKVEIFKVDGVEKTTEVCTNEMWYQRFHDWRTYNKTWESRSIISDNDHNWPLRLMSHHCQCLAKNVVCECVHSWHKLWDRYYSSGYQILGMNEGQSFIWLNVSEINPFEHYAVSLYWSAQSVGTIGNGDINILDHTEMIWSYFLLMVGLLWCTFIMAEYTAVLVVYDESLTNFFILVGAQRAYLERMGKKDLLSRVTQAEEMRFGSKCYLMDNERENLPTAIFAQIRLEALKSILPVIVGEDEKLTRGQLRLLALRLRRSIVPRGDYLIRDQDLVSNIYILAEGSVKVKYVPGSKDAQRGSEEFEDAITIGSHSKKNVNRGVKKISFANDDNVENENNNAADDEKNTNAAPKKARWKNGGAGGPDLENRKTQDQQITQEDLNLMYRVAEKAVSSTFEPGACFGLTGANDYEFWTGNIVAKVPCQVLSIDVHVINSMKEEFGFEWEEVLTELYKNVNQTLNQVMHYIAAVEMAKKKVLKNRKRRKMREAGFSMTTDLTENDLEEQTRFSCKSMMETYRNRRNIFHPAETVVNIFLLATSTFKLFAAMSGSLYMAFLGFEERGGTEPEYWEWIRDSFLGFMILSTLLTAGEIVFRFHLGFVDAETGRVVMEPNLVYDYYLKTPSQMPLDLASLLPIWAFYYLVTASIDPDAALGGAAVALRLGVCLLLAPIYVQATKGFQYFRSPAQCRPYSQSLLTAKNYIQLVLTLFAVFGGTAGLWVLAGCPNGAVQLRKCEEGGWIWIAYKTKPIKSSFHLLVNSFYFCMSTAVGAGVGDITAHSKTELYVYVLIMMAYTLLNGGLQASVVSAMYARALWESKNDKRRDEIEVAMVTYDMPKGIRTTVMNYMQLDKSYEFRLQNLFVDLNAGLRKDVHYALCKKFFKQLNLDCSMGIKRRLALSVEEAIYLPGDLVIPFGGIIDEVYFVVSGQVTWTNDDCKLRRTIDKGGLINDLSDIAVKPALYEVVAETVTFVYKLKFVTYCHLMLESTRSEGRGSIARPVALGTMGRGVRGGGGGGGGNPAPQVGGLQRPKIAEPKGKPAAAAGNAKAGGPPLRPSAIRPPPSTNRKGPPKGPLMRLQKNVNAATKKKKLSGDSAQKSVTSKKGKLSGASAASKKNKNSGNSNANSNASNARSNESIHRTNATRTAYGGRTNANYLGAPGPRPDLQRVSNLIDDLVNEEVDNARTQNATKKRSGEERVSDSEEEWMNIMDDQEESEEDPGTMSLSIDVAKMKQHLSLLQHFTEAERKMMREVEVWAQLIKTIKQQINPTGSDQVATILAWEAFHAGFRNMTLNANVNLHPPDDEKPKRRKKKSKPSKPEINYNAVKSHYGHLVRRSLGRSQPIMAKVEQAKQQKGKKTAKEIALSKVAKPPNKTNNSQTTAKPISPKPAKSMSPNAENPTSPNRAKPMSPDLTKPASPIPGKLISPNPAKPLPNPVRSTLLNPEKQEAMGPPAKNKNTNRRPVLTYVGQHIMQEMLDKEPKSVFQRCIERFNRKVKTWNEFYEDELLKRPDWEKIIHDAEID